eukprot:7124928-Alexandrium_andersonii.AAC.1
MSEKSRLREGRKRLRRARPCARVRWPMLHRVARCTLELGEVVGCAWRAVCVLRARAQARVLLRCSFHCVCSV